MEISDNNLCHMVNDLLVWFSFSFSLQVENSSFLELRVAFSGLKIISYFSLIHKLHLPDTAEKGAALPTISKSTWYALFSSFSCHIYVASVVAFLSDRLLKSDLCFWYLVFNSPAVSPTYVSVSLSVETVALYTTWSVRHFPGRGHSALSRQLHFLSSGCFLNNLELCCLNLAPIFGIHL